MRRTAATFTIIASGLLLGACSSPATTASSQAASTATPSAANSAAAVPSSAGASSAAATSLDPCQLVTSAEASSLAGTSYGAGKEESSGQDGKRCVYGSETTNVFTVEVGQDANPAAAQADWSKAQAQAQALVSKKLPAGITLSLKTQNVPGLADRAATVYGSTRVAGHTIGFSGIYLLKGSTFLAFQDTLLGHVPPSAADMESEAQKALARVP
jgi:hypothetical protein